MTHMTSLPVIDWDYADRMHHAPLLGTAGDVFFTYDGAGQRVRKVLRPGTGSTTLTERIYIGGWETFRSRSGGTITSPVTTEIQTLHVMDDKRRIAMVEIKITASSTTGPLWRFQLTNLIDSAVMELDPQGRVISYEEYHPYGSTAFRSSDASSEVSPKRYRFTGKERDEETGLYYHGARYYIPWLGRWTAADPAGFVDGPNLYLYASANPITLSDPSGRLSMDFSTKIVEGPKDPSFGGGMSRVNATYYQFGDDRVEGHAQSPRGHKEHEKLTILITLIRVPKHRRRRHPLLPLCPLLAPREQHHRRHPPRRQRRPQATPSKRSHAEPPKGPSLALALPSLGPSASVLELDWRYTEVISSLTGATRTSPPPPAGSYMGRVPPVTMKAWEPSLEGSSVGDSSLGARPKEPGAPRELRPERVGHWLKVKGLPGVQRAGRPPQGRHHLPSLDPDSWSLRIWCATISSTFSAARAPAPRSTETSSRSMEST